MKILLFIVGLVAYVFWLKHSYKQKAQGEVNGSMTRAQAAEILGVDIEASSEQVKQAHKQLMQKVHPDRGGSAHLAKQVNLAKNVLLQSK